VVYHNLKTEIRDAVVRGSVSSPIQDTEARQLPYLQACVLEGLRKHPPLSQLRERMVPPEGDVIQGHHIPGGTYIGLNAWGTQLDEIFGDDAEIYRPERWLIEDEERVKEMYKTHELIFGYGSTKCFGQSMAMMEL
jgi:cytochrome P450